MSRSAYTFLPWARQGLANQISARDLDVAVKLRAAISVGLELKARLDGAEVPVAPLPPRDVQLYGPGDIIGLDSRAIVRTEPRDWITNFEPNYLAAIEFYDEDLPWRYTPAAPNAGGTRLRPWIMLVVLAEGEFDGAFFKEGGEVTDHPLPFIKVESAPHDALFPKAEDLWAWAHVHANQSLTAAEPDVIADDAALANRLDALVKGDADLAYSRIVCPRKLEANKGYHAFLVPVFESGRLAGLHLDPSTAPSATASAWKTYDGRPEPDSFPIYFRWYFRTGAIGDFEYLVRLLQGKPVDKRVGVRDMDVQQPGANLPGIDDAKFNGVLQLGGALRVPRESLNPDDLAAVLAQENWAQPGPHKFQSKLAALINLADDYSQFSSAQANAQPDVSDVARDPDPLITPPLYGRWHAGASRLLKNRNGDPLPNKTNWIHELNLDPRFRVPAGFGTRVVQNKQEDLMAAAWKQVGDILEANRRIRRFQFSQQVSFVWHGTHLQPIADHNTGKLLALTAPVHARVMSGNVTLRTQVAASAVPLALVAPTMRRITRPGGRLMRALRFNKDTRVRNDNLIDRVNSGEVQPAPPKIVPPGVVTVDNVAAGGLPAGVPVWLAKLLRRAAWIVYVSLVLSILIALILWLGGFGPIGVVAVVAIGVAFSFALMLALRSIRIADALREENQTPASIDALPASPDFTLTDPGVATAAVTLTSGGTDSAEAARFKQALKELNTVVQDSFAADTVGENGPERAPLNLASVANQTLKAIDPALTITRLARTQVRIPPRVRKELPESFVEAMAYPVFDLPMYAPLRDLSSDLLIPNVNRIENNSITLLETNQKFIEAYMIGLNHEFARELLWREYPTDQRGSYFRQFWDVSSFFDGAASNDQNLREKLRDIPPLHRWPRASQLGEHDGRERPAESQPSILSSIRRLLGFDTDREEVVLAIRGELLKRYPNAVIYAQKAKWTLLANGDIDRTKERTLVPAEEENPPRTKLRTPLYEAKIEPDIYFFGFDLTVTDARGGSGANRNDPAGWFFVIKERPGEPRFGFDETSQASVVVYNDLGWDKVPKTEGENKFIQPIGGDPPPPVIPPNTPDGEGEKDKQRRDDVQVPWDDNVSSAELAYIMYQAPVMVAVHAAEMLPPS